MCLGCDDYCWGLTIASQLADCFAHQITVTYPNPFEPAPSATDVLSFVIESLVAYFFQNVFLVILTFGTLSRTRPCPFVYLYKLVLMV